MSDLIWQKALLGNIMGACGTDDDQLSKRVLQGWVHLARIRMIWKRSIQKSFADVLSDKPGQVTQCHSCRHKLQHTQAIINNAMKKGEMDLVFKVDISLSLAQWRRQIHSMGFVDETSTHLHLEDTLCKYFDGL